MVGTIIIILYAIAGIGFLINVLMDVIPYWNFTNRYMNALYRWSILGGLLSLLVATILGLINLFIN